MRAVVAVLSVIILLGAWTQLLTAAGSESKANQAELNKNVVRRVFKALEEGDLKTLNEVYAPKGPIHTPQGKVILQGGPYTDLKSSCPMCAAIRPLKIDIELIVAEGDLVTVRSTWSGKYTGTYRGTAVKETDVAVIYTNIYRIVDGRIVENWVASDRLYLAEQLGMKLTPPTASN
jgi:predicted SnoaL-like aldol condensation-catalyzing enzyme